ncbi:MAG: hypothetical protein NTW21_38940 [Verrucomicrobia bacterium]|nr:hypothetical protein [Verrucomicrobiota bacterium]
MLVAPVCVVSMVLMLPASAVIVAGANGGAGTTTNTTAEQLNAALGTTFANFGNVIKYSDSSGIYLGYNPSNMEVWVLSARHVTPTVANSTLTIEGISLVQQGSQQIVAGADLALIKYQNAFNLVPSLPSISLASAAPSLNQQIVMIGWGVDRVQGPSTGPNTSDAVAVTGGTGAGYTWRANSDANRFLRWGTNNVDSGVYTDGSGASTTQGWKADFDSPASGQWQTSNEATAALRDSGSGAFALNGGVWQLVGSASGTFANGAESPFTSEADFQGTFYTDIGTFNSAITATIGATLVPEASTACLVLLGGMGLLAVRRVASQRAWSPAECAVLRLGK